MAVYYWIYIIVAVYFLYRYFARNVNYWKQRGISGPKPLPLFGNFLDHFKKPINIVEVERHQKYGKIYGYVDMTQPMLSISDIDLIKLITMKDSHNFINHMNVSKGDPFMSKAIVNLEDDEWRRVRNICTPAFTVSKVKQMFELISKCVDNTLNLFDEIADLSKEIDLKKTFLCYTMDVIAVCVFGVEINSKKDPNGDFVRHAYNLADFSRIRVIVGLLMPSFLRQALGFALFDPSGVKYFKNVLNHVITQRRGTQTQHKDLVKLLLESGISDAKDLKKYSEEGFSNSEIFEMKNVNESKCKLNDHEILAQCLILYIAGTETTSTTLSFLAWILAVRSDIQEKLYEEIKHHFDNECHNYDTLMNLPYLNAVMNETMRRFSPIVHFDRVCKADYKLGNTGITIPKGAVINVPFYAIHHDPDYWDDPFEFIPERFLPENKSKIKPYTFVPFGIGPRICLGMNMAIFTIKAIIARVVYNFEFVKTKNTVTEPVFIGKKFIIHTEPLLVTLRHRTDHRKRR